MQFDNKIYDKIHACWMGKNIGGTLGGPYEGMKERLSLTGLPDIGENGPLPNDDLDLQLLNLHVIEDRGFLVDVNDFSEEWAEHVYFPYDEYGYALKNIRKNLAAPLSGYYNNPFTDCMGSPIRSELWAVLAPAQPEIAAYFAYQDSLVDHAGGEGMYGEVFFAVLESLAFEESDPITLIESSLKYIPDTCRVYNAVNDTLGWHKEGVSYEDIRGKILEKYDCENFTDAPLNLAFTVVGLLYGENFGDAMIKTVNLGYDTDCTVATLGSILGIIHGTAGIPASWSEPVGDDIVISPEVRGFNYPKTVSELTERTIVLNKKLSLENKEQFKFVYFDSFKRQDFKLPNGSNSGLKVSILCDEKCAIIPGEKNDIKVEFENEGLSEWKFYFEISEQINPDRSLVTLAPGEKASLDFSLYGRSSDIMTAKYTMSISRLHDGALWKRYETDFVLPVASIWKIDEKEHYSDGGLIEIPGPYRHLVETKVIMNETRDVKLICAATGPYKMSVDGETVIESKLRDVFIPAFHRCPEEQFVVLSLKSGAHKIEIEVRGQRQGTKIMLLAVAPQNTEQPGNYYSYIDCPVSLR